MSIARKRRPAEPLILDDGDVADRVERGELVRLEPAALAPDPAVLAELRARVRAYRPPRRRSPQ